MLPLFRNAEASTVAQSMVACRTANQVSTRMQFRVHRAFCHQKIFGGLQDKQPAGG